MAKEIYDLIEEILDNDLDFSEPWHVGIFNLPEKMETIKKLVEAQYEQYSTMFFYKEFHDNLLLFTKNAYDRLEGKGKDFEYGISWLKLFNLRLGVNYRCFIADVKQYIKGKGIFPVTSEQLPDFELN